MMQVILANQFDICFSTADIRMEDLVLGCLHQKNGAEGVIVV